MGTEPTMSGRSDAPYWDALTAGSLRLPQCNECGLWLWPAQARCKGCGGRNISWSEVAHKGRVYSWTRTHVAFLPAFADLIPYTTVLVRLPQAGDIRLLGHFLGDADALRIDCPVKGIIAPGSPRTLNLAVLRWDHDV